MVKGQGGIFLKFKKKDGKLLKYINMFQVYKF